MNKNKLKLALLSATTIFGLGCQDSNNESNTIEVPNKPLHFEASVESLQQYKTPEWFRDAKLGIYMHWGVYSVAERGEWYARNFGELNIFLLKKICSEINSEF